MVMPGISIGKVSVSLQFEALFTIRFFGENVAQVVFLSKIGSKNWGLPPYGTASILLNDGIVSVINNSR